MDLAIPILPAQADTDHVPFCWLLTSLIPHLSLWSLPSTPHVLTQPPASPPRNNLACQEQSEPCPPSLPDLHPAMTWVLFDGCCFAETFRKASRRGKGREEKGKCLSDFQFFLLPTDFCPLNNFPAIVSLVLCKIKATKNMPQIHSIPMEHNRAGQSPAWLYWAASEMGKLNSSIRC